MPTTVTKNKDEALLIRITCKDEQALAELYDQYVHLVYAVALRITGDRQTTEEVVQDVFQTIWQTAHHFQPKVGSCTTWLLSITRHRAIDAMRSKRERARTRESSLAPTWPISDERNPAYEVEQRLLNDDVRAALQKLPPNQRHAIELAYYGGLTCNEIAERLCEPIGTIKTRLRLGLGKLRETLSDSNMATNGGTIQELAAYSLLAR